jgi:hypothetical protein
LRRHAETQRASAFERQDIPIQDRSPFDKGLPALIAAPVECQLAVRLMRTPNLLTS